MVLSPGSAIANSASDVAFTNTNTEGAKTSIASSFGTGLSTNFTASGGLFGQGTVGATFAVTNTTGTTPSSKSPPPAWGAPS
jgi:hypothetical protein